MTSGFQDAKTYRYWNEETRSLDFDGFCEDLSNAPENAVIILHGCAHNPTGLDPTEDQWKKIAEIIKVSIDIILHRKSDNYYISIKTHPYLKFRCNL